MSIKQKGTYDIKAIALELGIDIKTLPSNVSNEPKR